MKKIVASIAVVMLISCGGSDAVETSDLQTSASYYFDSGYSHLEDAGIEDAGIEDAGSQNFDAGSEESVDAGSEVCKNGHGHGDKNHCHSHKNKK